MLLYACTRGFTLAVDFQVVFPQEVIKVNSVRWVPDSSPPQLDIIGDDFSAVDEVLINEIASPAFLVLSRTRLIAVVPDGISSVDTVSVISRRLVLTEKSILRFRVSRYPSKVSGILRLVQLFTKLLLTTPGTDIFSKKVGAAGIKNVGATFSKGQAGSIVSDFVVAVQNTQRQIITIQSRQPRLPPDEKLLSARVSSATFSSEESALIVSVELTSYAGKTAIAQVMV